MRVLLALIIFAALATPAKPINNPGAVKYGPMTRELDGLADPPQTNGFCNFRDIVSGVRAVAKILLTYQRDYGLNTVGGMVGRYAPRGVEGNHTVGYVLYVSGRLGVISDEVIDIGEYAYMRPFVEAIIAFENIGPFPTSQQIDRGLELAGIRKNKEAMTPSWIYGFAA